MTAESVFNYLALVAALWVVAEGALLSIWKPFVLHPLRQAFFYQTGTTEYKSDLYAKVYGLIVLVFLFISGALTISPAVSYFDVFGIFNGGAEYTLPFGLSFSYWYGALVTNLVMVAGGELIHDFLVARDLMPEPGDVLPPGVG